MNAVERCATCGNRDCPGLAEVCVGYVRSNNLDGEINAIAKEEKKEVRHA